MSLEDWKNIASIVQSIATILSFMIGGLWVYMKFIRQQEGYPNIDFSVEIEVLGEQNGYWLIELIATIENKGKAQHKMKEFRFDVNGLQTTDNVEISNKWGGQIDFPHIIAEGSFLPDDYTHFFIDPGTKAKYSYITRVPRSSSFIILHCWFKYMDKRFYEHTAEKTIKLPTPKEL